MRLKSLALALLALNFLPAEEKPLPKALPAYGPDRPMPAPQVHQRTLANGLTVWLVPREGLPRVVAYLAVKGGNASDPKDRRGISGIMAGLLKEGTSKHNAQQLADQLQAIGGDLYAGADADGIFVRGSALSSGTATLLGILGEVARNPSFPEAEVALTRSRTLAEIQAQESEPSHLARKAFKAALFGDHPYSFAGLEPGWVAKLDRAAIQQVHASRFRPDQALLMVVGQFDPKTVNQTLDRVLGDWRAQGPLPAAVPAPDLTPRPTIVVLNRPDSVQTTLMVGRTAPAQGDPQTPALSLAAELVGGSFGSRITTNIREDKGYTYSPWLSVQRSLLGGNLAESAAVRNEVTGATVMEIFYEMERMGATDVGAEELNKAKRSLAGSYLFQTITLDAYGMGLASAWLKGQGPESLAERVPKIQAVTAADVRKAARTFFNPRDLTVVAVGNEAVIREELAPWLSRSK